MSRFLLKIFSGRPNNICDKSFCDATANIYDETVLKFLLKPWQKLIQKVRSCPDLSICGSYHSPQSVWPSGVIVTVIEAIVTVCNVLGYCNFTKVCQSINYRYHMQFL